MTTPVPNSLRFEQREGPVCCALCGVRTMAEDAESVRHEVDCMDLWCREGSVALGAGRMLDGRKESQ